MRHAGILVPVAACMAAACAQPAAAAEPDSQTVAPQQVQPNPPPPEEGEDYRPPWADPDAKPPEPGIDDDPTPFNPSNVDGSSPLTTISKWPGRVRPAAEGHLSACEPLAASGVGECAAAPQEHHETQFQ